MNVLVTGANGLLATNTIIKLLERGYQVRGLIRDINKFLLPSHENLELVLGDITNLSSLEQAMVNCDYVIHCAATTDQNLLHYDNYHRINVLGTENVIQAALKNQVKKIVYVGTANTFGHGTLETPGDETLPPQEPFKNAWYAKSKLEGQHSLLTIMNKMEVTVVSPTFMIGPYDGKPSSGTIIRMGYRKRIIFHPPGGKNFVNVEDAANGVVMALEKGKNGEAYLLAGENLSYRDFFKKLAYQSESTPILISLPKPLLLFFGYIGSFLRVFRIKTALSITNMKILCAKNYYSNKKAKQVLGTQFQPIEVGIANAINWFKAHQML